MPGPYASFEFQAPADRISLNGRYHWATKAKLTAAWRTAAKVATSKAQAYDLPPCIVNVTFYVAQNRRRDTGNLAPTTKAIVDGMVDAKAWPDDNVLWVCGVRDAYEVDKTRAGLVRVDCWLMAPKEAA